MKRILFIICICIATSITFTTMAHDPAAAERYAREAEYYQRQADTYLRDAESYLRQAKGYQRDAASYIRSKNYDRARDSFRRAADAMDKHQTKLASGRNSASKAEDYLKKAANALN